MQEILAHINSIAKKSSPDFLPLSGFVVFAYCNQNLRDDMLLYRPLSYLMGTLMLMSGGMFIVFLWMHLIHKNRPR